MLLTYPVELPISAARDEIIAALAAHRVVVIAGDTGSGKTTQIPKMCLEAGRGRAGLIGCTQPRRIAAVSVAERVAEEIADRTRVGYKIRFRDRTTADTLIKFMTDGILLAETRQDRELRRYDTLIIDEAHERSLNIDFLLGYLKTLLLRRDDLHLVIASATIDTGKFSAHFDNAPIINVSGRTYPITVEYIPAARGEEDEAGTYLELAAAEAVSLAEQQPAGDLLMFLPTERDILDCTDMLRKKLAGRAEILPLFGRLQAADQRKIFRPARLRKIIVATNIAETSITVPGVRYVIDTGLARIARYNPRARFTSLQVSRVARASCDQRSGRCGRTGPGICLRLFSEEDYLSRPLYTQPEIQRANLAEVILQMLDLQLGDPRGFPFIDPPSPASLRDGFQLLQELGAVSADNRLTGRGRAMAGLPLDPCIARMLVEASELGCLREVKIIAAGLSIQDPRIRPAENEDKADEMHKRFADKNSDFTGLLNIWNTFHDTAGQVRSQSRLRKFFTSHYLSWQRMREWQDIHDQITLLTRNKKRFRDNDAPASYEAVHQAVLSGFLRNIGFKKQQNIYRISGGREMMLFPGSALFNHGGRWIVCASFMETTRLFGLNAANVDVRWLEAIGGELCRRSWSLPHWEKKGGMVAALETVTLFGLVIVSGRRVNYGRINARTALEAREIFIRQALMEGELGGKYPFLQHNLELISRYRDQEDRTRRRNIVVDEHALYSFYDHRLGPVHDRHCLNRDIKKHGNDLYLRMTVNDICLDVPDADELYRFPETLRVGSHSIGLSYIFEPGNEADGVTADIPQSLAPVLNPAVFEWLVPGLLEEKVAALLKNLPKSLRRRLVPLPESTARIMDELELYRGSLYVQLEKIILRRHRLQISRTEWAPERIPVHLKMRFRLVGQDNRVLAVSRSYQDMPGWPETDSRPAGIEPEQQKAPVISDIRSWDFPSPPEPIPSDRNAGQFLYPALYADDTARSAELRYIAGRQESYRQNPAGLRLLHRIQVPAEIKALSGECKSAIAGHSASWLALGLSVPAAELRDMLLNFLLDALFDIQPGPLPSCEEFSARLAAARQKGIVRQGREMLAFMLRLLRLRREIQSRLSRPGPEEVFADLRRHLHELLPADFLKSGHLADLQHTERYLKGLAVRLERAEQAPAKDSRKAEQLTAPLRRLEQFRGDADLRSTDCCSILQEYRQMIEEFRISVFAPELGTAYPVSAKRLERKWQEVENLCLRVE